MLTLFFFFFQRIHRHELFTPPAIGTAVDEGQNKFQVWVYPKTALLMRGSFYSCRRETTLFSDISCVCHLFQLKTIEALLGSTAKMGEVIVLGMITQLKEVKNDRFCFYRAVHITRVYFLLVFETFLWFFLKGKFYLEDLSGTVQLDMSKAISFKCLSRLLQEKNIQYSVSC